MVYYGDWDNVKERDKAAMENITVQNIDRTNPELWRLKRMFEPSYIDSLPEQRTHLGANATFMDALVVDLKEGNNAELRPDIALGGKNTLGELRKYLNEDELDFLKQDYIFALTARTTRCCRSRYNRGLESIRSSTRERLNSPIEQKPFVSPLPHLSQ
jgi:hypothetical protein